MKINKQGVKAVVGSVLISIVGLSVYGEMNDHTTSMVTYFPVPYVQYHNLNVTKKLDIGVKQNAPFYVNVGEKAGENSALSVAQMNVKDGSTLTVESDVITNSATFGNGSGAITIKMPKVRIGGGVTAGAMNANQIEATSFKLFGKELGNVACNARWMKLRLKGTEEDKWYLVCCDDTQNNCAVQEECEEGKRQVLMLNGEWSGCASEAAITAYEAIKAYDSFARQIRDAQEVYYGQNGKYSIDLRPLGVNIPSNCRVEKSTLGNAYICGNNIFIDNSMHDSTTAGGLLFVFYCPGYNSGYTRCANKASNRTMYFYDPVIGNISAAAQAARAAGKTEFCTVLNNSSLGQEVCDVFYQ